MAREIDDEFYDRADAHIDLSNAQLNDVHRGLVSASMLYATARFNAWVSACGFSTKEDMAASKEETLAYFVDQYRLMLSENLDDYIARFDRDIRPKGPY